MEGVLGCTGSEVGQVEKNEFVMLFSFKVIYANKRHLNFLPSIAEVISVTFWAKVYIFDHLHLAMQQTLLTATSQAEAEALQILTNNSA